MRVEGVTLTYTMNILQGLRASVDFCVTLNREYAIDPEKVLHRFIHHHPVYTHPGKRYS